MKAPEISNSTENPGVCHAGPSISPDITIRRYPAASSGGAHAEKIAYHSTRDGNIDSPGLKPVLAATE